MANYYQKIQDKPMKMTKGLWICLIFALFVRLLLAAITFHPDLSGQSLTGYFFSYENITNIYDHLVGLPESHPLVKNFGVSDIFIYPPLTYFTIGTFLKFFQLFIPQNFFWDMMNGISVYSLSNLNLNLVLIKLPYIIIDLIAAFVLASLFDDQKQKRWAFLLWLINPVTLYATSMMGVFDIIPAFFTILSLVFVKKKNLYLAAVMLSLGAAYKQYPIFLLPFLVFAGKNLSEKIKIILAGVLPYLLTILPFADSPNFRAMVFGAKSQKMFYMEWMLTGAEGLYPYLLGYLLLLFHSVRNLNLRQKLWKYYLGFFIVLFSVTHYHPQWFLWLSPFLVIEMVANRWRNLWLDLLMLFSFVFIVFTFDNSLNIGMFAVVNHNLTSFTGLDKIIASKFDILFLKSAVRSLFAAAGIFLIFDLLGRKKRIDF